MQRRGIDPAQQNARIEKKAQIPHYTPDQELVLERIRDELTRITNDLREANEMELPEETFRVAEEQKKKELNDCIENFNRLNIDAVTDKSVSRGGIGSRLKRSGSEPINANENSNHYSPRLHSPTKTSKTFVNGSSFHSSWRSNEYNGSISTENHHTDRRNDDYSDSSLEGGLGSSSNQYSSFSTNRRRKQNNGTTTSKSEFQPQRV